MKVLLVNIIKPIPSSGDGITEYTYQLSEKLKLKGHKVEFLYVTSESKRVDIKTNIAAFTTFRAKIKNMDFAKYDVVHITNHELGFVAKIIAGKYENRKITIVTTVHDLMRFNSRSDNFNKGIMQTLFDRLVTNSMRDAFANSNLIIYAANGLKDHIKLSNGIREWGHIVTMLPPKDEFRIIDIPTKVVDPFIIGFVGALSYRKNVRFILETAKLMQRDKDILFIIYGKGPDEQELKSFVAKEDIKNVVFMGFADEDELVKTYDKFNIFFYPSKEEGSSLPILDALARKIPVVIYKDNMMDTEIMKYCYVADTPKDAKQIIERIHKNKYDKTNVKKALKFARSLSWDKVAKETIEGYKSVLP